MDRKRVFAAVPCLAFLAVLLGGGVVLAANGYGLSFYVIGGGKRRIFYEVVQSLESFSPLCYNDSSRPFPLTANKEAR